jgi:hypothetical protein
MQHIKLFLSLFIFSLLCSIDASAQITPAKATKTWESNGLSTAPAAKTPDNIDLGNKQREETIKKMEKEETETNEIAISGDGRLSKIEDAILNRIRSLKESLK